MIGVRLARPIQQRDGLTVCALSGVGYGQCIQCAHMIGIQTQNLVEDRHSLSAPAETKERIAERGQRRYVVWVAAEVCAVQLRYFRRQAACQTIDVRDGERQSVNLRVEWNGRAGIRRVDLSLRVLETGTALDPVIRHGDVNRVRWAAARHMAAGTIRIRGLGVVGTVAIPAGIAHLGCVRVVTGGASHPTLGRLETSRLQQPVASVVHLESRLRWIGAVEE